MKYHVLPARRAIFTFIGILLFVFSWASPPQRQVQASPLAGQLTEEEDGMHLKFLPAQMRQLCKGDSTTFTLWSYYYESPVDPNRPIVPSEPPAGPPSLAPLVRYVEISALNGQVSPNRVLLTSPSQYMRFTYTAAGEGQDTITAVIDDGSASVEKRISVLPTCEYDISFLELSSQTIDTGGFYVTFKGDGEFFVNRTSESVGELAGNGQDDLAWLMWAFAPGAFSCTMDKITANSTFEVEGMLNAEPYNFLHVNLRFAPVILPGTMVWHCNGAGIGAMDLSVPIGDTTTDPDTMDMVGLTFPLQGGVEEFEVPNGYGYVVVTRR